MAVLRILREGFWREALALLTLALVLGAFVVGGIARGVYAAFEGAVEGIVGAPGEFDLVVHLRRDAGERGVEALLSRLDELAPGSRRRMGPEIAGRLNVLVQIP